MKLNIREFQCVKSSGGDEGESTLNVFYEQDQSTRISCSIDGPMQKQMGGDTSNTESCQVKVNVEFINQIGSNTESILDQFPDEKEYIG